MRDEGKLGDRYRPSRMSKLSWSPSCRLADLQSLSCEYKVPSSLHSICSKTLRDCQNTAIRSNAARPHILTALAYNKQARLSQPTSGWVYPSHPPPPAAFRGNRISQLVRIVARSVGLQVVFIEGLKICSNTINHFHVLPPSVAVP